VAARLGARRPYKNGPFSALNTGLDSSALNLYYDGTLS